MSNTAHRRHGTLFEATLSLIATLPPLLLVLYAFVTLSDTLQRAHVIVQGSELIVAALACALVLRCAYLLGAAQASALSPPSPLRAIEMA